MPRFFMCQQPAFWLRGAPDALGFQRAAGIDEAVQFFIEDDPVTQKALAE
jgi:hypothetical protein